MFFNSEKRNFELKYPGYINVLNNTFGPLEIKNKLWDTNRYGQTIIYLYKNVRIGNQSIQLYFFLEENENKFDKIKFDLDFDYYMTEQTKNFSLNDLSIRNHLMSKFKGGILNKAASEYNRRFSTDIGFIQRKSNPNYLTEEEKLAGRIADLPENATVYDALGRPNGIVQYNFVTHKTEIFDNEKNPDVFYGYKHKSNFLLTLKIQTNKTILYEGRTLLDSDDIDSLKLSDYDTIKNNIEEFLCSFEESPIHKTLSNNLNIKSLINTLTGNNFSKINLKQPSNNGDVKTLPKNSLDYMNSTLIPIKRNMYLKFRTEIMRFESNGYVLIHGNFLSPPDHIRLLEAITLVKEALFDSLDGLISEIGDQAEYSEFLLDKWNNLIEESEQEVLQKFLNDKNIKLFSFRDEEDDDPYRYLT
jgi:hypothetical protein